MTDLSSNDLPDFEPLSAVNPADVRFAAMNLLARREHSLWELHRKLRRRFDDEAIIEAELLRLSEENLQSDERFAESYARQRAGRGYGPVKIRQEMHERGLSDAEVDASFASGQFDWPDIARQAYRKKFGGPCADAADYEAEIREQARRLRFMQYRGFSTEHYRHLIDDYKV